jgi:hypothetical protein
MFDIEREANAADVIISGYAIARSEEGIRVLNLNNGKGAAVFMPDGTLIESNMDDIEAAIARDYMLNALKYMEDPRYA